MYSKIIKLCLLVLLAKRAASLNAYRSVLSPLRYQSNYNRIPLAPVRLATSGPQIAKKNVFNDRATILYKPQTAIVANVGQDKQGACPITRHAGHGYTSFKQVYSNLIDHKQSFNFCCMQYQGLWFKRYRSQVRPGEPFFKCAWIDYVDQGNNNIFIMDHLQNNA